MDWQSLPSVHEVRIEDVLDEQERANLALLLAQIIVYGHGSVTIEIVDHQVRYYVPAPHLPAVT